MLARAWTIHHTPIILRDRHSMGLKVGGHPSLVRLRLRHLSMTALYFHTFLPPAQDRGRRKAAYAVPNFHAIQYPAHPARPSQTREKPSGKASAAYKGAQRLPHALKTADEMSIGFFVSNRPSVGLGGLRAGADSVSPRPDPGLFARALSLRRKKPEGPA